MANTSALDLGRVVGTTFIPSVAANGDISWTNDGGLDNPPTVNIMGPPGQDGAPGAKGDKGDKGDPGQDATIPPATAAPLMDGAAAVGMSAKYAREDHRHPIDTSRASAVDVAKIIDYLSTMEVYRTASGNPAAFSDGKAADLKALTVTIAPTQSGSGDPYPPGGGKNKLFIEDYESLLYNGIQHECANGVVSVIGTATRAFSIGLTTNVNSLPAGTYTIIDSGTLDGWWFLYNGTTGSDLASKSTPTFTYNGTDTIALKWGPVPVGKAVNGTYKFMLISASETDTSYAPYSNIRPITGVSSVTVARAGWNLWPMSDTLTFTQTSYCDFPTLIPPGTYTLSAAVTSSDTDASVCLAIINVRNPPTELTRLFFPRGSRTSFSFTTSEPLTGVYLYASNGYSPSAGDTATFAQIQLEYGSSATDYTPSQNQSVIVPLVNSNNAPLTVYGGTLDVTAGRLSVTWANIASYNGETLPGRWMSDRDAYAPGTSPTTGAQVVYELAAPVAYTLTPAQLAALAGYNSVSADAGTLSVTYLSDPEIALGGN